jgi:hypothetical protein
VFLLRAVCPLLDLYYTDSAAGWQTGAVARCRGNSRRQHRLPACGPVDNRTGRMPILQAGTAPPASLLLHPPQPFTHFLPFNPSAGRARGCGEFSWQCSPHTPCAESGTRRVPATLRWPRKPAAHGHGIAWLPPQIRSTMPDTPQLKGHRMTINVKASTLSLLVCLRHGGSSDG